MAYCITYVASEFSIYIFASGPAFTGRGLPAQCEQLDSRKSSFLVIRHIIVNPLKPRALPRQRGVKTPYSVRQGIKYPP
jgi:hypothetical protein